MAWAKGSLASGTGTTTANISTATAGSTFLLGVICDIGKFTSAGDNRGNVYTSVTTSPFNGAFSEARLFFVQNGTGSSTHNFWASTNAATGVEVFGGELVNVVTSGSFSDRGVAIDIASPFVSPTISTAAASLVSLLAGNSASSVANNSSTTFSTVVQETNGVNFYCGAIGTRLNVSSGTYNASWTQGGAQSTAVFIVSFLTSSAGAAAFDVTPYSNLSLIGVM